MLPGRANRFKSILTVQIHCGRLWGKSHLPRARHFREVDPPVLDAWAPHEDEDPHLAKSIQSTIAWYTALGNSVRRIPTRVAIRIMPINCSLGSTQKYVPLAPAQP